MTSKDILFICRGAVKDGLGHVMRSCAVVEAFPQKERVQLVVIGDEAAESLLQRRACDYTLVKNDEDILPLLEGLSPSLVVFDMIHFPVELFEKVKKGRLTVSISPVFNLQGSVDGSFSRTRYDSDESLMGDPKHRRDRSYTVISKHCMRIPEETYSRNLQKNPLAVGISMGGADAFNLTLKVLEELREVSIPLLFWVMVGEGYSHSYQELIDCVKKDTKHEVIVAKTMRSMWRVLDECSLLILASGITTYEAAYGGLPSINLLLSDRQRFLMKELEEHGSCYCLRYESETFGQEMRDLLTNLNSNREDLLDMHRRGKLLVDGLGAYRIATELISMVSSFKEEQAS